MNVSILLGPPGAGKGTVSNVFVAKGYSHISTGELLRGQIQLKTPLGLEAKASLDAGKFVSDTIVINMIRDLFEHAKQGDRFLLDGFPRNLEQAKELDAILKDSNATLDTVTLLDCPAEVIVERLSGRRTCSECGTVYHLSYNPSAKGLLCEADDAPLTQRADDLPETVTKRLDIYVSQTAPLIDYYQSQDLVRHVDASLSINEVRDAVLQTLEG